MNTTYFKCLLICSVFCLINTPVSAQVALANKAQTEDFFKSTTCFVNFGKPFSMYNAYMKESAEKVWRITPYTIIAEDDFEKQRQDKKFSFILVSEAVYTENKKSYTLDILNFVCGAPSKSLNDLPDLGSLPLCYANDDEEKFLYRFPALLKTIQYQIALHREKDFKSAKALLDYHNSFASEIKNKELWLTVEQLEARINTKEKLKNVYPGTVKIVSTDEIEKAILDGYDILFLHLVAPFEEGELGKCFKFIISAASGQVFYAAYHNSKSADENALLISDFKEFTK